MNKGFVGKAQHDVIASVTPSGVRSDLLFYLELKERSDCFASLAMTYTWLITTPITDWFCLLLVLSIIVGEAARVPAEIGSNALLVSSIFFKLRHYQLYLGDH